MSYLVIKVYSIECDHDGCDVVAPDVVPIRDRRAQLPAQRAPLRAVRAELAEHGWQYRDGRDICPLHSGAVAAL